MITADEHTRWGVTMLRAAVASVFLIHGLARTVLGTSSATAATEPSTAC